MVTSLQSFRQLVAERTRPPGDPVLKPGFEVETPVTRARGIRKLDEHAMPGLDVLRSEITELKTRILEARAEAALAYAIAQQAAGPAANDFQSCRHRSFR
jgi:hypothetical protein